jgi:hypothetical protein
MLLLRVGRKSRWDFDRRSDEPGHVEAAASDLSLRPADQGLLSVYKVECESDEREVALRYAVTCRNKPEPLDYVVFPADLATALGLTVAHEPSAEIDPYLSDRHYGISGLDEDLARRLAAAILAHSERRVRRIPERALDGLAISLLRREPGLEPYLKGIWPERLKSNHGEERSAD